MGKEQEVYLLIARPRTSLWTNEPRERVGFISELRHITITITTTVYIGLSPMAVHLKNESLTGRERKQPEVNHDYNLS